jgi:homoserine kinase type II
MLAKMHRAGTIPPLPPAGEAGGDGITLYRPNDLSLTGWYKLAEKIGSRIDEIKSGLAVATAELLHELKSGWPNNLQSGIIHADLFPDNVFFDAAANVSGAIDFYFSCTDSFLYDYAIVQNAWCFDTSHKMNEECRIALFDGYIAEGGMIADNEWQYLPIVATGAALRFFLTRAHDLIFGDPEALVTPKDPLEYWQKLGFYQ